MKIQELINFVDDYFNRTSPEQVLKHLESLGCEFEDIDLDNSRNLFTFQKNPKYHFHGNQPLEIEKEIYKYKNTTNDAFYKYANSYTVNDDFYIKELEVS